MTSIKAANWKYLLVFKLFNTNNSILDTDFNVNIGIIVQIYVPNFPTISKPTFVSEL